MTHDLFMANDKKQRRAFTKDVLSDIKNATNHIYYTHQFLSDWPTFLKSTPLFVVFCFHLLQSFVTSNQIQDSKIILKLMEAYRFLDKHLKMHRTVTATLCSISNKQLFKRILNWPEHVLHAFLPPRSASKYNLRNRPHNRLLCQRASQLTDCNFITRMLYCDMYWLYVHLLYCLRFICWSAFWHFYN